MVKDVNRYIYIQPTTGILPGEQIYIYVCIYIQ